MTASFLAFLGLFDWTEAGNASDTGGYESPDRRVLPDLAARDVSAEEQQRQWNELAGEYLGDFEDSLFLGGHYPDCAIDCKGDHAGDDDDEAQWWEGREGEEEYEYDF